jgi:tetratricopeptide (TPR) repeat protein
MNLQLRNPRARLGLVVFSSALALSLCFFAIRNALAAHALGSDTREGYERAVRLEAHSSRNWYLLGRSYLYDLERPDPPRALLALQKAVDLDPYSAEALLDLSAAYEGQGQSEKSRRALGAAERVYPLSADVRWSYGNFLLRQGEKQQAFAELRRALELDPKRAAEAFSRAQAVEPDPSNIFDKVIPPSAATYLPVLALLCGSGDLDTARLLWARLVALGQKVPLRDVVPFFDALGEARRVDEAALLWPEAVAMKANPPPPDPPGSLLWDGGFESGYSGGGFSWQFPRAGRDVQISFDRSEKHTGQQSLRILFYGRQNIDFTDGCHPFVPEAGRRYLLSAWVKTQSLSGSEGVRLQIFAFSGSGNTSVETSEVHGTQPWSELTLSWKAPQDSGLGKVCARRRMSDMPGSNIQGAAWIDDVALLPLPEEVQRKP